MDSETPINTPASTSVISMSNTLSELAPLIKETEINKDTEMADKMDQSIELHKQLFVASSTPRKEVTDAKEVLITKENTIPKQTTEKDKGSVDTSLIVPDVAERG